MTQATWLLPAAFSAFVALGCASQTTEPKVASSAGLEDYATRYPTTLSTTRGQVDQAQGEVNQAIGQFPSYPDELNKPNWSEVMNVVDLADESGRSGEYVRRARADQSVSDFFATNKDDIERKVGGAANYAAKQNNCKGDLYGTTAHALETAVQKQLQKDLRARNEAESYIDEHQDSLGKPNVDKLKADADAIANASYLANVGVVQTKADLERMIQQASDVKSTLERVVKDETAAASAPGASDAEKKAAQARAQAAQDAETRLDSEVSQAQAVDKQIDQRIKQVQDAYAQALSQIKQKIQQKQSGGG
jgi:hypothetical protein